MLENHRLRRSYTTIMLHLALDLVSLCSVFKGDTDDYIQKFGKTLKETCKNNPNIAILDTGSRVEGLYLPHIEGGRKLNVDADHMIIRSDVTVYEMVDQGSTKTESYIHKTNEEEVSHKIGLFLRMKCLFLIQNFFFFAQRLPSRIRFPLYKKIFCRHEVFWTSS